MIKEQNKNMKAAFYTIIAIILISLIILILKKPGQLQTEQPIEEPAQETIPKDLLPYDNEPHLVILSKAMREKNPALCMNISDPVNRSRCIEYMELYIIPGTNMTCDPECMNKRAMERKPRYDPSTCANINDTAMRKGCEDYMRSKQSGS